MSSTQFVGIRCRCGELIFVPDIELADGETLEGLRDRLRPEWQARFLLHVPSFGCGLRTTYTPDDLVYTSYRRRRMEGVSRMRGGP